MLNVYHQYINIGEDLLIIDVSYAITVNIHRVAKKKVRTASVLLIQNYILLKSVLKEVWKVVRGFEQVMKRINFTRALITMWHVVLTLFRRWQMFVTFSVADFTIISVFNQSRDTSQIPVFIMKFIPQSSNTTFCPVSYTHLTLPTKRIV